MSVRTWYWPHRTHTHIHQADTLHVQAELQKKLADLTKADMSKFHAHIKTEDQERERIQRHFGSSTKRTHMAAAEYQASKRHPQSCLEAGPR